jgi:succinate dehydrogenase / fumarate reductase flavoprotein subunit
MSMKLGLVRDRAGLEQAVATARAIHEKADAMLACSHGDVIAISELKDLCETALACAQSALCRTESRAAHYRSDFPEADAGWVRTVLYEHGSTRTRPIDTEPDEPRWLALREARMSADGQSEREHVE